MFSRFPLAWVIEAENATVFNGRYPTNGSTSSEAKRRWRKSRDASTKPGLLCSCI